MFNQLLDNLEKDQRFSFLHSSIKIRRTIENIVLTYPNTIKCSIKTPLEDQLNNNSIRIGEDLIFADKNLWDLIFKNICENTEIPDFVGKQKLNPDSGQLDEIENALQYLINDMDYNKKINNINISYLRNIVCKDISIKDIASGIALILQNKVLIQAKQKNAAIKDIQIPYTLLARSIGNSLFSFYLLKQLPEISDLILYYDIKSFSLEHRKNIQELFLAIYKKDNVLLDILYQEKFKIHIPNKTFEETIKNIVVHFMLERIQENNSDFTFMIDLDSKILSNYAIKEILLKNDEFFIGLGSIIIENLINFAILTKKPQKRKKDYIGITINDRMTFFMNKSQSMYKPALIADNVNDINTSLSYKNKSFCIFLQSNYNLIHKNPHTDITIKKTCYLKKHDYLKFGNTKLSIDLEFLYVFLDQISPFINKKIKDLANIPDKLYDFLLIYNIDFKVLVKNGNAEVILNIINFALDYTKMLNPELKKLIKRKIPPYQLPFYTKLYSKLINYKLYINCLLKDLIIYSLFSYYIPSGFIDSQGRYYLNGYTLNPNSYPISKAFIKLYDPVTPGVLEKYFVNIKKAFIANIDNTSDKNFIAFTTQAELKKETEVYHLNYIYNFFKKSLNFEYFCKFMQKPTTNSSCWFFVTTHIKSIKNVYIAYSYILLAKRSFKLISNACGFDATNSGLQCISILFKDSHLGANCNVAGLIFQDIYTICGTSFKVVCDLLFQYLDKIKDHLGLKAIKESPLIILNDAKYNMVLEHNVALLFEDLLILDLSSSLEILKFFKLLYNKLYPTLKDLFNNSESLLKYKWVLPTKSLKIADHFELAYPSLDKNVIIYFLILNSVSQFKVALDNLPWLKDYLFTRELFKQPIMTYGYNATSFRRQKHINEFLTQKYYKNKFLEKKDIEFIKYITIFAERYFSYFSSYQLSSAKYLKNISAVLTEENRAIILNNKYFIINFKPIKYKKKSKEIFDFYKKRIHQLSLCIPSKNTKDKHSAIETIINKQKFKRKFGPFFIHTMDAMIVHLIKEKLYHINKYLFDECGIILNHSTNHDCFMMTIYYFLKPLVRDCYITVYGMDYFSTIEESINASLYSEIKKYINTFGMEHFMNNDFANPYFIKV